VDLVFLDYLENPVGGLALVKPTDLLLGGNIESDHQRLITIENQHNTSIGQAMIGVGVPLFLDDLTKANLLDSGKAVGAVGGEVEGEGQFRDFSHGFLLPFFVSYK